MTAPSLGPPPGALITVNPADLSCPGSMLRQVSRPVQMADVNVVSLVADMIRTLRSVPHGRGISAIQIGVPARLFVINITRVPGSELVLINPVYESVSGRMITRSEGCMSLPDYKGLLARRNKVVIRGLDLDGREARYATHGYEANVIQHEMDHLDGILYWDRMPSGTAPKPITAT
jgi:peptide deformylase